MKLLITGGLGFIGSNYIRYVFNKNPDVEIINIDNCSYGSNEYNLVDIVENYSYTFVQGDITDRKLLRDYLNEIQYVINFAAQTHVDRSISSSSPFVHSNLLGTIAILDAIKNTSIRMIQISTDEVYGDILHGSFSENDKLSPSSPYAASKAAADLFALSYHRTFNIDVSIVRATNNYGPYQFPEKLIPKTIIRAMKDLSIPVYGDGKNVRDWIFVDDFCEAIDIVRTRGKPGEIYNIPAKHEMPNISLVKEILSCLEKPETLIEYVEDRPGHDIRYSLDNAKISKLSWSPRHTFKVGLTNTINWYKKNKEWWEPIINEKVLSATPWKNIW